jgi:acetyl-CoA carboxylase / biotin carboxylase 1
MESIVTDFCRAHSGTAPIASILLASNGNAAIKEIRSIRHWSYTKFNGNERAISFVVMATPEDLKANGEFVREADVVVQVPGGPNNCNYANVNLIVDIAERSGVQVLYSTRIVVIVNGRQYGRGGAMRQKTQSCLKPSLNVPVK